MPQPERYVISGTLLTSSPLAIHSGLGSEDLQALGALPADQPFRRASAHNAEDLESCDRLIIRDGAGRPYIPGSSLKGVLRDFLTRDDGDDWPIVIADWLLGTQSAPGRDSDGREEDQGEGGAGVFEDAFLDTEGACVAQQQPFFQQLHRRWFSEITTAAGPSKSSRDYAANSLPAGDGFLDNSWRARRETAAMLADTRHLPYWDPAALTYVEHQIAVDRRSGTAGEHKLFTSEVVPAGIPFQIRLIVDHHPNRALPATQMLLRALAGFNLDPVHEPICLGSGSRHGWGRMVCLFSSVRVQAWSPDGFRHVEPGEIDVPAQLARGLSASPMPRKTRVQLEIELAFQGPLLVNDPAKVCVLEAVRKGIVRSGEESEKKNPDHVPRVAGARIESNGSANRLRLTPLLPGTGAKGPIRAQLERILRSLDPQIPVSPHGDLYPVCDDSPPFVKQLFGYQSHESGLWCSEFVGAETDGNGWSLREMVAIDRFTGGASDHAKFDALVLDRPTLRGVLTVDLPPAWPDAAKTAGAVVLMLRDLVEGDIAFGMGDMKSFGQCTGTIAAVRVAGLPRCPQLQQWLAEAAGGADVNQWLGNVRDRLFEVRQAGQPPESRPAILNRADDLIDVFLQAVRGAETPERHVTGA